MLTPKYLIFRISGQKFAVKYSQVLDITNVPQPAKAMHLNQNQTERTEYYSKKCNYQMIDLRSYLGIIPEISRKNSIVIVSSEVSGVKHNFGILVDEINGMFTMDSFAFHPYRTLIGKNINDIREAITIIDNEPIVVINPNKINNLFRPIEESYSYTIALLN